MNQPDTRCYAYIAEDGTLLAAARQPFDEAFLAELGPGALVRPESMPDITVDEETGIFLRPIWSEGVFREPTPERREQARRPYLRRRAAELRAVIAALSQDTEPEAAAELAAAQAELASLLRRLSDSRPT